WKGQHCSAASVRPASSSRPRPCSTRRLSRASSRCVTTWPATCAAAQGTTRSCGPCWRRRQGGASQRLCQEKAESLGKRQGRRLMQGCTDEPVTEPIKFWKYGLLLVAVAWSLQAFAIWSSPYPPLIDLPNHMARHYLEAIKLSGGDVGPYYDIEYRLLPNLG